MKVVFLLFVAIAAVAGWEEKEGVLIIGPPVKVHISIHHSTDKPTNAEMANGSFFTSI